MPVSLIYNDASGALVEREQFVGPDAVNLKGASAISKSVKGKLSKLSSEQRVGILLRLLADEMDPVGEQQ